MRPTHKQPEKRQKIYDKSNCQLVEFPVIKLHIFSDIQILNLRGNLISDLNSLTPHIPTCQSSLSRLKEVDLSLNQLPSASTLLPLALSTSHLYILKVSSNPMVHNLNYLYEIAVMFPSLMLILGEEEIKTAGQGRERMVRQQMVGGKIMGEFLKAVGQQTRKVKERVDLEEQRKIIEKMVEQLHPAIKDITQGNNMMFQLMDRFVEMEKGALSGGQSLRSPIPNRKAHMEIQAISEYQITKHSPKQSPFPSQYHEIPLSYFYYKQLLQKPLITSKLTHQFSSGEPLEQHALFSAISNKWADDLELTYQFHPEIASIHTSNHIYSPLHSGRGEGFPLIDSDAIFFALDRDWTLQTQKFVQHRLLSLLKAIQKHTIFLRNTHSSPMDTYKLTLPQTYSPRTSPEVHLQTFAPHSFQLNEFRREETPLPSPKSRNRFIIGSLINVLQGVIKKIVLRRIIRSRVIKEGELDCLVYVIGRVVKRLQEGALRKIFETAVFFECLKEKMEAFRLRRVFKAWKGLKKRKMKLLKSILNRKGKKEKAFMSVFLTQYRLNSRNLTLSDRLRSSKAEFLRGGNDVEDMSCILARSATCHKTLAFKKNSSLLPRPRLPKHK